MADTQLTVHSERDGRTTLSGTLADGVVGGHNETFILPATIGEAWIYSVSVLFATIDVILTNVQLYGPALWVYDSSSGLFLDPVGTGTWTYLFGTANALAVTAFIEPREPVLWRRAERLYVGYMNPDTDATPTGDLTVTVRVRRIGNP